MYQQLLTEDIEQIRRFFPDAEPIALYIPFRFTKLQAIKSSSTTVPYIQNPQESHSVALTGTTIGRLPQNI